MMLHPDDILRLHNSRRTDLAKQFKTTTRARETEGSHGDWQPPFGWAAMPSIRRRRPAQAIAES